MDTKISQLRSLMAADDWKGAILFAAKFPRLGEHKAAIERAREAILRPAVYQQMGRDPAALISTGIAALKQRYQ